MVLNSIDMIDNLLFFGTFLVAPTKLNDDVRIFGTKHLQRANAVWTSINNQYVNI